MSFHCSPLLSQRHSPRTQQWRYPQLNFTRQSGKASFRLHSFKELPQATEYTEEPAFSRLLSAPAARTFGVGHPDRIQADPQQHQEGGHNQTSHHFQLWARELLHSYYQYYGQKSARPACRITAAQAVTVAYIRPESQGLLTAAMALENYLPPHPSTPI